MTFKITQDAARTAGSQVASSGLMGNVEGQSEELLAQTFYFPPELIGGSCPLVKGEEEKLAWNAAAEACDSERIHFVWRAHEDRVWWLAVRSSDLASHPQSWCPFASLLPGMIDAAIPPVIYTYFSEETAIVMAVDVQGLQIIRGTQSVVKAKAERMARDMGNAEMVDLVIDSIVKLKAVSWESRSLLEDRARRFYGVAAVVSAITVTFIAVFIWFFAAMAQLAHRTELADLQDRTANAINQLQQMAMVLRTSEMREQLASFNRLNESLVGVQGWLKRYTIEGTQAHWWAIVPENVTSDRIQELGAKNIETLPEGLVIADRKESVVRKGQK